MEGCFEILIPKNEFVHDDMDFDALMRGEASSSTKQDDSYKDVIQKKKLISIRLYKLTFSFFIHLHSECYHTV